VLGKGGIQNVPVRVFPGPRLDSKQKIHRVQSSIGLPYLSYPPYHIDDLDIAK